MVSSCVALIVNILDNYMYKVIPIISQYLKFVTHNGPFHSSLYWYPLQKCNFGRSIRFFINWIGPLVSSTSSHFWRCAIIPLHRSPASWRCRKSTERSAWELIKSRFSQRLSSTRTPSPSKRRASRGKCPPDSRLQTPWIVYDRFPPFTLSIFYTFQWTECGGGCSEPECSPPELVRVGCRYEQVRSGFWENKASPDL